MKKATLTLLAFIIIFFGCSKIDDEKRNYVKLDNVSYTINSAEYFVEKGNLTIQFETSEPNVFLYFKGESTIPMGETNVSYESLEDNCVIVYCFETENYFSIDGTVKLSLAGGNYTVETEGHTISLSSGDRDFKIHYKGSITMMNQGGSGSGGSGSGGSGSGGSGGGSYTHNRFWVSPAFSYFEKGDGEGRIDIYCNNDDMSWSAESDSDWCRIINNASGVGDGSIMITVNENLSIVDRSARITFTSGDGKTTQSVYVMQHSGGYDMVVKPERLEFGAFGNTDGSAQIIHVYIYTGNQHYPLNWTATGCPSWAHLSATSGTASTDIRVVVNKNNTSKERVATIRFESENHTVRYVTLYQKGGTGGNDNFKVAVTNAEYQIQQNNNMVVKVRYYIQNQSSSATIYYLKFGAIHPSGYYDEVVVGSKTNPSAWTLAPGSGTYTNYRNVNFQYQEGNISGEILECLYY